MRKNYTFFALLALVCTASFGQITVAQWNFNGDSNTTVPGGATSPTPSISLTTASASLVGGTTATFANGNNGATPASADPAAGASPTNYAWNSTTYPAQNTESKTRGVQFNVSTVGYAGIMFKFEQRLSNTSANNYQIQYTTDASATTPVWVDFVAVEGNGVGDTWYVDRLADASAVTALDNNPNVAFRVVSMFDGDTGAYTGANYSTAQPYSGGTVRYDMVSFVAATSLSVHQPNFQSFTMSPNPTRHGIVQLNQAQDVSVFDLLGKKVFEAKETTSIDTRNFRTGVYSVKTDSGISRKLIVE